MTHDLKTLPEYFAAVESGVKNFEVRRNDRNYQVGDKLELYNSVSENFYGAEFVERWVTYVLPGGQFGIEPGFVVMGLSEVKP